jgi:proliferating cell nuclear antigen
MITDTPVSTVAIECTKEGVKFAAQGDIGSGSVTLRTHTDVDKPDQSVSIELTEPVHLTFSLKYLENFCKASGLSGQVKVCLSAEVPLLVEYALANNSYLRFYLAPKVSFPIQMYFLPLLTYPPIDWR